MWNLYCGFNGLFLITDQVLVTLDLNVRTIRAYDASCNIRKYSPIATTMKWFGRKQTFYGLPAFSHCKLFL